MLLYKIISDISDINASKSQIKPDVIKSGRKIKAKPKVVRDLSELLRKADEEYRQTVLLKERQSLSRSRSFN